MSFSGAELFITNIMFFCLGMSIYWVADSMIKFRERKQKFLESLSDKDYRRYIELQQSFLK